MYIHLAGFIGGPVDCQVMRRVNNIGTATYQRNKLKGNEEGLSSGTCITLGVPEITPDCNKAIFNVQYLCVIEN